MAASESAPAVAPGAAEGEEETILYDLLVNTEWPPETEVQFLLVVNNIFVGWQRPVCITVFQPRGNRKHGASFITTKADRLLFLRQYIWYSPAPFLLPDGLVRLVNKQINWHLVLASNGKLLAAVQDQCVEIRSAKDDFTSIIGKCQVPKDPKPQWRRVAWSYDCTLLAYAESTGTVRVFDLVGSELFVIAPASSLAGDLSYAVAGLIFLEYKASAQWSAELLVINYRGELRSYLVSVGTNQSYQESHCFSFSGHYPRGVNTAVYHPGHRLLLVGGCEPPEGGASKAARAGLSAWRVLSGSPYYKQVTSGGDAVAVVPKTLGLLRMLNVKLSSHPGQEQDGIFKMSLSPNGTLLAAIHFSGKLSIWAVPSLKQQGEWHQSEQPGYDDLNPDWTFSVEKRKKVKDKESLYPLVDVNWWADSAVILARCSGALTVSSVKTLRNLLGKSCEWFEPAPQVTAAHDGGFLSLECEIKLAPKRSRLESRGAEEDDGEEDADSDQEVSAKARYFGYVRQGLYLVTEMERFAPPRKRPRAITKHYRLVSLRSTTPEELYHRKIESEEYEEALSLAQTYGLDTDLVYQRQWRKSAVNIASIQNYLSKIKKRSWVLHECLERVPENVDAAKELLQYGLTGTDLEALLAIGRGVDDGRFTLPGEVDIEGISYEELVPEDEPAQNAKERERRRRGELLRLVDFSELTLEQKELCRCRLKLLTYLDRLATYEQILGVSHASEQSYDAEFFKTFRNQNIVLSARTYARESNVPALEILFTFHGSDLLPHRLALLSNFPETTSPHQYSALLPEACYSGDSLAIIPWHERKHREKDWCEEAACRMVVEPSLQDESEFLYAAQPELLRFKTSPLAVERAMDWYRTRAEEIEHHAGQVDCALSLVRLGMERSIPGLLALCDDLVTLEALVYEAGCDLTLTLKELQQMQDIEKLRLLMNSCSEDKYVTGAYQWMVPFLHRCEKQAPGAAQALLREYLVTAAQGDLRLPLKIFQHSKPDLQQKIIPDQDQLMAVALDCIYSCERSDQLFLCYDILECLPQRGYGPKTEVTAALHDRVDQLEQILSVSELLEKHGLEKPISFVKNTQSSAEEARKLMVRLTRHTGRKQPPASEAHWRALLQDMLAMQRSVYTCLEPDACYEIFAESLLCSSRLENIHLAGQMMHCCVAAAEPPAGAAQRGRAPHRVSYEASVALVLAASREYFNSSASLSDSCMDLARCCLQLITDKPPAVQEELDLIQAVGCLEEFGVKILPLQVRLRSDRLSLIKECLCQAPSCYKLSAKLLGLAELLRVAGDDPEERRGQVLILLVEQALRFHDYKAASVHCQELMAAGYSKSWDVCSQLGQSEGYQDLATRQELMAFALTHCPPGSIEPLLAASSSLQTEILYQRVNFQIHREGEEGISPAPLLSRAPQEDAAGAPGGSSADLLHWTTATTMKVLSNTTTTTRAVLQAVSDGQWWRKSLTYLRPLQGQEFGDAYGSGAAANEGLERQGCHPFYESVLASPFVAESQATYGSYQPGPGESFAEVLLRTGKLAETESQGGEAFPTTEVLLQLASDALPSDMTLALAYLLALPQVLDANQCFEKQARSALSLQLAAYYYSLQIYARLAPCFRDKCHPLYRADPKELITMVTRHVTRRGLAAWPEDVASLTEQLHYYNERLLDFTQAQLLRGLRKGVDVQRFTTDDQYKRETILGLAETLEEDVYGVALSLAQRYGVSRWEVYMTHLEFLFSDSGLSTVEIENRAQALHLFETLKTDPDAFHKRMVKYIYPTIGGTDHERLLYYFTLLEGWGCPDPGKYAIKPETHIRLLKKFKVVASGLNYKKLTEEGTSPLDALQPVLSSQNILSISKLVPKIPGKDGRMLSASSLYALWLQKLFWAGDPQLLKEAPAAPPEWLRAFELCTKYLDRLLPGDLIAVLDAITFSPDAVAKLPVDVRTEMTSRAIQAVQHLMEKPRRRNPEEDAPEAGDPKVTYADTLSHLEKSLAHLGTLRHAFIVSLRSSEQEILRKYSHLYDLSRSEKGKLHDQAVAMCLDGQPLAMIRQLLAVAVGPLDLSPKDVVQSAVTKIISALSGGGADLGGPRDPLQVLEGVVAAVRASVDKGEELVSPEDLLQWLRPFCADDARPVRPRVHALQVLGQSFELSEEDGRLLVLFRTEAILRAAWPQRQVAVADVDSEESRSALFTELLEASRGEAEFQHLALLLQAWPPASPESAASVTDNPWVRLAAAMLSRCPAEDSQARGEEVLRMCRSLYSTRQMLPAQCVEELSALLRSRALLLPALKLLLESPDARLHAAALEHVAAAAQVDDSNCDQELLSLLLDARLLVPCLSTPFYPRIVRHLLASPPPGRWDAEALARDLREAGHEAEAGSLLLAARGTHRALRTFSTALGASRLWV